MFVQMKKILNKLFNAIIGVSKDKLLHFICGLLITQIVIAVVLVIVIILAAIGVKVIRDLKQEKALEIIISYLRDSYLSDT